MRKLSVFLFLLGACSARIPVGVADQEITCPINQSLPVTPQGTVKPQDDCCDPTPVVLDLNGEGFDFTSASDGVDFDIRDSGTDDRVGWPAAGSGNAFLALDRDGDGMITSGAELFGNATEQPAYARYANGYNALSVFDWNGDGVIDASDPVFSKLLLWQDLNHDGISQPEELHKLAEFGITGLGLNPTVADVVDEYGNKFYYRARVYAAPGSKVGHFSYDMLPALLGTTVAMHEGRQMRVNPLRPPGESPSCVGGGGGATTWNLVPRGGGFGCTIYGKFWWASCAQCPSDGIYNGDPQSLHNCPYVCTSDSGFCAIQSTNQTTPGTCVSPAYGREDACWSRLIVGNPCNCAPYGV